MRKVRLRLLGRTTLLAVLVAAVVAVPAATVPHDNTRVPYQLIEHASQGVAVNYWVANPDEAPTRLRNAFASIGDGSDRTNASNSNFCASNANRDTFNCDVFGLPQNEESIASCPRNDELVLGGTNDYRGLIDPQGNFTGWHWSIDGGHSVTNEGLLPPVTLLSDAEREVPSGGDPVKFIPDPCDFVYAASLAYDPNDPFGEPNGIAVYRSTPEILTTCEPFLVDGLTNPACWPQRRLVAESAAGEFLDKEWMFVGWQGGTRYVWVTYSTFNFATPPHEFTAEIHAVRCTDDLVTCTEPIPISEANGPDLDVQFSDVTVGPDGRAYITWTEIVGELAADPDCDPAPPCEQTFIHKIRVEQTPGAMDFGPEQIVYVEERAIPFGGFIHANDFRVATYPKNEVVRLADGTVRKFLIWDACQVRLLGFVCEEAEIKLSWSDDPAAATWTSPIVISKGGDNYFPTITADRAGGSGLAAAWFTHYYDNDFHNRQDVVAVSLDAESGRVRGHKRVTVSSNETEADPLLGGFFIGDYIEAVLIKNRLYVHWNANYRKVPLLAGLLHPEDAPVTPLNQQDNYLTITGFAAS